MMATEKHTKNQNRAIFLRSLEPEEREMKVTQKQNRNQLQVVCQEVLKVKEEIGMKMTRQITYVMTRLY